MLSARRGGNFRGDGFEALAFVNSAQRRKMSSFERLGPAASFVGRREKKNRVVEILTRKSSELQEIRRVD